MPIAIVSLALSLVAATPSPPSGPTLAIEDTMHAQVPEVLVRAPRVTLDEILDRVMRGEARRESLLTDQTFTAVVRVVRDVIGKRTPQLYEESVWRVYRKRPNHVRSVQVRHWSSRKKKAGDEEEDAVNADFSPGMGEEIVNFAFRPNARRDYRYRIEGRDLVGNHVIYRIAFEPISLLDPTNPSGLVWVDTNDFVIVREELTLHQSPVPLILKGINRMVVERQRVDRHWVLKRVLLRGEFTVPIPKFGRSFDVGIVYSDYRMNAGLSDSLFAPAAKGHPAGAPGEEGGRR
jgi:hypothetical protein